MGFFPPIYSDIINVLVALAIIAHFLTAQDNDERIKFSVTIIGFFALLFLFENEFFFVQTLVICWLILTGTDLLISRTTAIALLIIILIISTASAWFFIITFCFYVIILAGFLYKAFDKIANRVKQIS
ncbi:MAG: hypothetical protein AABW85_01970 [archaeon]